MIASYPYNVQSSKLGFTQSPQPKSNTTEENFFTVDPTYPGGYGQHDKNRYGVKGRSKLDLTQLSVKEKILFTFLSINPFFGIGFLKLQFDSACGSHQKIEQAKKLREFAIVYCDKCEKNFAALSLGKH
ncbi:MAG: hypothetical protein OXE99_02120, partial [Cellvibrionales bacterium]|nr:hypothetical protein [Cellvibrionales bacterium]